MKIEKTLLQIKNKNGEWIGVYPRTTGDMVSGIVNNSRMLNGKEDTSFMPSTFTEDLLRVRNDKGEYQGTVTSKVIVGTQEHPNSICNDGEMYVENAIYINGNEVATKNEVEYAVNAVQNGIYTTTIKYTETTGKLKTPIYINNVQFDGSQSINIKCFTCQSNPPDNHYLLWINTSDGTINYYSNGRWNTCVGAWGV